MSAVGTGAIVTCVIVVLWAGSWVFAVIERSLNRIWGTTSRTFWHGRALTIGMIGIVGVLLAFSVFIDFASCCGCERWRKTLPRQVAQYPLLLSAGSAFWQRIFAVASFLITVLLFVVVYRFMPRAEVNAARHFTGRDHRWTAVGNRQVCFRLVPELFSLRSDLRIGRRGRRGANLELRIRV